MSSLRAEIENNIEYHLNKYKKYNFRVYLILIPSVLLSGAVSVYTFLQSNSANTEMGIINIIALSLTIINRVLKIEETEATHKLLSKSWTSLKDIDDEDTIRSHAEVLKNISGPTPIKELI